MRDIFSLLGQRIKQERQARHLSQQELAGAAGVDTTHLSRIESGKAVPSLNAVKRLADGLSIPIAKLFEDIPVAKAPDQGYTGKIQALIKDAPEKKRTKALRLLKSFLED